MFSNENGKKADEDGGAENKMGLSGHHNEKKGEKNVLSLWNCGHRMDKCIFLPARRPVATATTTKWTVNPPLSVHL